MKSVERDAKRWLLAYATVLAAVATQGCEPGGFGPLLNLSRVRMPAFAPDSSAFAFVSYGAGLSPPAPSGLLVTTYPDGAPHLIANSGLWPAWSPDSRWLAFAKPELTIMDLTSGSTTALTPFEVYTPQWSPDGTLIAFATGHQDPHGSRAIWLIRPDGTGLVDISVHGTGEWLAPAWDPASRSIVHVRYGGVSQVHVMSAGGTDARRLSHSELLENHPRWSPDSASIVFVRQHAGKEHVWIMGADGSGPRMLAEGHEPNWLPSGAGIIYTPSKATQPPAFLIVNRDGTGRRAFIP